MMNLTRTLTSRIGRHADMSPGRMAVVDKSTRLTYSELEHRSAALAACMLKHGVRRESCVGLYLERSIEFVVAALAVLKAGAAYLPIDTTIPADRAEFMVADSEAFIVLTAGAAVTKCPKNRAPVLEIDGLCAGSTSDQAALARIVTSSEDLAYVVYTSGTTGRPKGVEITHGNLTNLVDWHVGEFGVTTADRASQVSSVGFDAAAWEIWPHLAAGAAVHIADDPTRRSPHGLRDWLISERITISFVPTVLAEQLMHLEWPAQTALRTLLTGADRLHRRPPRGLPFRVVNNYGPTECTVVSTSGAVATYGHTPTIGRPIANAEALILDEDLCEVSRGEVGELCLAGALVGRGYRKNPALTSEKFATIVDSRGERRRVYRTGDRARLLADGDIDFLGRRDDQVKIRGYRVELGEIVTWLNRYPGIDASTAIVQRDGLGQHIVAYVVGHASQLSACEISDYLASRIPDYMLPSKFVRLDALPVTAHGKLDKPALPAPCAANVLRDSAHNSTSSERLSGVQDRMGVLVAALLNRQAVDVHDNIFLLGGHSMLGVQLVSQIRQMFGVRVTLRQVFSQPTVAGLSGTVERLSDTLHGSR